MKKISIFLIAFLCSWTPCNSQYNCYDIPTSFASYKDAISSIKSASFKISEKLPDGKSSWINYAAYYSCDGKLGYMIFAADNKEYVHDKLPLSIWNAFKNAPSSGSYYVHNIKGSYRLVLK